MSTMTDMGDRCLFPVSYQNPLPSSHSVSDLLYLQSFTHPNKTCLKSEHGGNSIWITFVITIINSFERFFPDIKCKRH